MIYPERYPEGHPLHDADHVHWSSDPAPDEPFQWSADTIEWVADVVERRLKLEA